MEVEESFLKPFRKRDYGLRFWYLPGNALFARTTPDRPYVTSNTQRSCIFCVASVSPLGQLFGIETKGPQCSHPTLALFLWYGS